MGLFMEAVIAAAQAMLKVIVIFATGILSAHWGFLSESFIPLLSNFNFYILMPCLVISNLGRQIDIDNLVKYWPILLWACFNIGSGYLSGFAAFAITRPRKEYSMLKTTLVSAMAYSNSVSLPIVILDSLSTSPIFSGDPAAIQRATALCFMYSIVFNLMMYIAGYPYLLELTPEQHTPVAAPSEENEDDELEIPPTVSNLSTSGNRPSLTIAASPVVDPDGDDDYQDNHDRDQQHHHHTPHTDCLLVETEVDIDDDPQYPTPLCLRLIIFLYHCITTGWTMFCNWFYRTCVECLPIRAQFVLRSMATNPNTVAIFVALFLGLIRPIKNLLYSPTGTFSFLIKAIDLLAGASIPLGTLITSANVYHSVIRNFGRNARILRRAIDNLQRQRAENDLEQLQSSEPTGGDGTLQPVELTNLATEHDKRTKDESKRIRFNDDDHVQSISASSSAYPAQDEYGIYDNDDQYPQDGLNSSPRLTDPSSLPRFTITDEDDEDMYVTVPHDAGISTLYSPENNQDGAYGNYTFEDGPHMSQSGSIGGDDHHDIIEHDAFGYPIPSNNSNVFPFHQKSTTSTLNPFRRSTTNYAQLQNDTTMLESQTHRHRTGSRESINQYKPNNPELRYTPSTFVPRNGAPVPLTKEDTLKMIEFDENGEILPLPRLSWAHMIIFSLTRLVVCPLLTFSLMYLCHTSGIESIFPNDGILRVVIILTAASTTAETILMIVSKAYRTRQVMMISLIFVLQFVLCLFTIPVALVISITIFVEPV